MNLAALSTTVTVGPDQLDLALRTLTLGPALLLVGALPVCAVLLRPPSPLADSPDVLRRLVLGLRVAAVLLAMAAVATLVDLGRDLRSLGVEDPWTWSLLTSDFGAWTAVRVLLGAVLVAVLPVALLQRSRGAWVGWAVLAGTLTLSLPLTSHAASTGLLGISVDAVHLVAGAVWLAGVVGLACVVPPALRAARSSRRRSALLLAGTRFSRLAVVAVLLAVVTGLLQPFAADVDLAALPGSTWGAAATAKVVLVVLVVAAGALNHRVLLTRLDAARGRARVAADSSALIGVVSLEVVLGVAVVLSAALLVSVPQP